MSHKKNLIRYTILISHEVLQLEAKMFLLHDTTVTSSWARLPLKSPTSRLFTLPSVQEQIKENTKVPRHWPLWGESPWTVNSPYKGPVTWKMFPFDDVVMGIWKATQVLSSHKSLIMDLTNSKCCEIWSRLPRCLMCRVHVHVLVNLWIINFPYLYVISRHFSCYVYVCIYVDVYDHTQVGIWCCVGVFDIPGLMMTSSNGNIFRVTGPLCGELTGPGEFSTQRPVTRIFDVFFDLRLNKRLSKQPGGWWFEMPSWPLWRQCNVTCMAPQRKTLFEYVCENVFIISRPYEYCAYLVQ